MLEVLRSAVSVPEHELHYLACGALTPTGWQLVRCIGVLARVVKLDGKWSSFCKLSGIIGDLSGRPRARTPYIRTAIKS